MNGWHLGVVCVDKDTMKHPFLMTNEKPILADSYEEAKEKFLSDPTVAKRKVNDLVVVQAISAPSKKPL